MMSLPYRVVRDGWQAPRSYHPDDPVSLFFAAISAFRGEPEEIEDRETYADADRRRRSKPAQFYADIFVLPRR